LPVARDRSGLFKMGELVRRTGFTRQQIHNFLTMGLIKEETRTAAGHRLFGTEVFKRLSIIRGLLAQDYPLAEIRRTWKAFLRVVVICASLVLGAVGGAAAVRAAEEEQPAPVKPSPEDLEAVRRLFDELCRMMTTGDGGLVPGLLAPEVGEQRLQQVLEQMSAEFESRSYTRYEARFDPASDVEMPSRDRMRVGALLYFEYRELARNAVLMSSDEGGQHWDFELARTPQGWRFLDSKLFDTFGVSQDRIFEGIFLWAAVILIVGCFWGWMFLDCCFRSWGGSRLPWLLVVLLLPGLGALVYFFAVWMRQSPED
jgi:hypothetical protein